MKYLIIFILCLNCVLGAELYSNGLVFSVDEKIIDDVSKNLSSNELKFRIVEEIDEKISNKHIRSNELLVFFNESKEIKVSYDKIIKNIGLNRTKIIIGSNKYDQEIFDKYKTGLNKGFVFYNNEKLKYPFECVMIKHTDNNTRYLIVYGVGIEGELVCLKKINSNKRYYDYFIGKKHFKDINGLMIFDYLQRNYNVDIAFNGLFDVIDYEVITNKNDISLRFRHFKPLISSRLRSRLFEEDLPIVFAGGLWSNLTAWEGFAKELGDEGYKSYMIEITGGPGQDCEDCFNYNFTDLIDEFWPSLIGAVQSLNNGSQIVYVGHSNGARTGISSLERHKNVSNVGQFNGVNVSMIDPVKTFVAVGVPGSFEGQGVVHWTIKKFGKETINQFNKINQTHVNIKEIFAKMLYINHKNKEQKISLNLWNDYFDWINSNKEPQIGINLSLENFLIFKGNIAFIHDFIVTTKDEDEIFNNIISSNKKKEEIFTSHLAMIENKKIQNKIKRFI